MLKNFINSKRNFSSLIHIIYLRNKKKRYINRTKRVKYKNWNCDEYNNEFKSLILNKKDLIERNIDLVLFQSNHVLNNNIPSISGEFIYIGNKLKWNKDYINDYIWPVSHYSEIKTKNFSNHADVKNVWEFSRFYFLTNLAKALYITKEVKYYSKIEEYFNGWVTENPINIGVNWTVGMEVAIRSVNLIEIYSLITASKITKLNKIEPMLENEILKQIYDHEFYLKNNLEKGLNSNNHYLSNLVGLLYINIFLRGNNKNFKSNSYIKEMQFLIKELNKELEYQVYNDGFSYEDSISYHALNLEMIISVLSLLKINNINISNIKVIKDLENKAYKMFKALHGVLVDGSIPVIGDIDNGRLLIFDEIANQDKTAFMYLIEICAGYFEESIEENIIDKKNLFFFDSGLYKYKFPNYILLFRSGKIGQNGLGGHAHNDQLSILLYIKNKPFFIDSGTGNYTSNIKIRNLLRSTKSHNTLEILGVEQNDIDFDIFKMKERTFSHISEINEYGIKASHKGYVQDVGAEYTRELNFDNEAINIIDSLNKFIDQKVKINFILDSQIIVNHINQKACELIRDDIKINFETEKGYISIEEVIYSNNYGTVNNTKKLSVNFDKGFLKNKIKILIL